MAYTPPVKTFWCTFDVPLVHLLMYLWCMSFDVPVVYLWWLTVVQCKYINTMYIYIWLLDKYKNMYVLYVLTYIMISHTASTIHMHWSLHYNNVNPNQHQPLCTWYNTFHSHYCGISQGVNLYLDLDVYIKFYLHVYCVYPPSCSVWQEPHFSAGLSCIFISLE